MSSIEIHKNSITHISTDVIVNAANSSLAEGGGVCGAIFSAAGSSKLARECAMYGHCKTGRAVITSACDITVCPAVEVTTGTSVENRINRKSPPRK